MQISPDDFQRVQFLQALLVAVQQWTERQAAFTAARERLEESERDLRALGAQLAALTGAAPVAAPSMAVAPNAPIAGAPAAVTMPVVPAPPPTSTPDQKPADEVVLDWMRGNPQAVTP